MTEQLVRDRQTALDAEARDGRLARRVERPAQAEPGRRRLTLTARALTRRLRGLAARSA